MVVGAEAREAPVLRFHVDGDLPQPVLIVAEHFGDAADGDHAARGGQFQAASRSFAGGGRQFQGSNSLSCVIGVAAMLARTCASHACGSMLFNFAETIMLYITAARSPPRSEPANSHDFRPNAIAGLFCPYRARSRDPLPLARAVRTASPTPL
jgi:hypothetical protein